MYIYEANENKSEVLFTQNAFSSESNWINFILFINYKVSKMTIE